MSESSKETRIRGVDNLNSNDGLSLDHWIIPDYEPLLLCGRGAYGSVWAVRDRVGVCRALKVLNLARFAQLGVVCRERSALETYCRSVSRHPWLITISHVGEVGSLLYYTMELADDVQNRNLTADAFPRDYRPMTLAVAVGRPLRPDVAIEIARRLLRGLCELHTLDLVHRDIKPSNIVFIDHAPKLADIGMLTEEAKSISSVGTPLYMPPDKVMDRTGDTYAMGKILHEMIVGGVASTFPALPNDLDPRGSRWDLGQVSELLTQACAHSASQRFESAPHMLESLEACDSNVPDASLLHEIEAAAAASTPPVPMALGWRLAFSVTANLPWILFFAAVFYAIYRWL